MKKFVYLFSLQFALSSSMDVKAMDPVEQENPFRKAGGHITQKIMQKCRDNDLLNLSMADKWTRQTFLALFEQKLKEDTRGRQVLNQESVIVTGKRKRKKTNSKDEQENKNENEQESKKVLNFKSVEIAFNEGNPHVVLLVANFFPNMSPGHLDKKLGNVIPKSKIMTQQQAYAAYLRALLHLNGRSLGLAEFKQRNLELASSEMFDISEVDVRSLGRILEPDFGFKETLMAEANYFLSKAQCLKFAKDPETARRHFNILTQALPFLDEFERIDANFLCCILRNTNSVDENCMRESESDRVSIETLNQCLSILRSDDYTFNNKTRIFFSLAKFLRYTASQWDDAIWMPIIEEVIKHKNNDKRKSITTTKSLDLLKRFLLMTYPVQRPNSKYNELLLKEDRFFHEILGKRFEVLVQSIRDWNTVSDSFHSEVQNMKTYFKVVKNIPPKVNLTVLLLEKAKTNDELKTILREFRDTFDVNAKNETRVCTSPKIESLLSQLYDDVQKNNNDVGKREAEESSQDTRGLNRKKLRPFEEQEGEGPWDFAFEPSHVQDENNQNGNETLFGFEKWTPLSFDEDSFNYGG